jgi:hypothetical protein
MIHVMTPHSIPVFFCGAGIGKNRGVFSPQIRDFDVFYKSPIIVGFHVIGDPLNVCDPTINLEIEHDENSPKVLGFYAYAIEEPKAPEIELTIETDENMPQVWGFYAFKVSDSECMAPTVEITNIEAGGPAIESFQAEGISDK